MLSRPAPPSTHPASRVAAPRGCGQIPHGPDDLLYRGWMRSAWGPLLAAALIVASALTGCAPQPAPAPTASAAATDPPVFASDAEALAAATKAYAAYQAMSSRIAHEGGADPERMADSATGDALRAEITSLEGLSRAGLRGLGQLAFDSLSLQTAELAAGSVETYLCLDVSGTDVVNADGVTTVPPDRVLRLPLQVSFVQDKGRSRLLVEKTESWSGTNFC
jgi:hypothetical protein